MNSQVRRLSSAVAAALVCSAVSAAQAGWSEDFDSYVNGYDITNSSWDQWDNVAIADSFVTTAQSLSAPHSLYTELAADVVQDFNGTYTTGYWNVSVWTFVPATMVDPQWFVALNDYFVGCGGGGTCSWSGQASYDPTVPEFFAQVGPSLCTGANQFNLTAPLVIGAWAETVLKIDLCGDIAQLYYDGNKVGDPFQWSSSFGPGVVEFDTIDLYANNNPTPGDRMYWDDLLIKPATGPIPCCEGQWSAVATCPPGVSSVATGSCVMTIAGNGVPSASQNSGFTIDVAVAPNDKQGLVFYGKTKTCFAPVLWGPTGSTSYLCVKAPTQRMTAGNSGNVLGQPCTGSYSVDWNTFMANNAPAVGNPRMVGEAFDAQYWVRDPGTPKTTTLSAAMRFCLAP